MTTDTQPLAPTDAELTAIYKAANGEDTGKAQPLTTQRIFRAMRAAIAKWSTPAGAGEVVAHRVMRKSLSGEWASDARDWSDGPPSRALVDSICADKGRWRIDVAYAAPAAVVGPSDAEPLHITHGPLMRHAAYLLRSRKPALPEHESVAAELELAADGQPTPSGEPSEEWLEVVRLAAAPTTQPAPQADSQTAHQRDTGYPPLPKPKIQRGVFPNLFTEDQMRAYVDADRAARAPADSVTAPAAGAVAGPTRQQVFDRFGFLEGLVAEHTYTRIVDEVVAMLAAAPTPPAQAADSVLEDAARLDWLLGKGRCMGIDSFGGQYRVVDTSCSLVVTDWMPTQRAAIDAARKQGENHD